MSESDDRMNALQAATDERMKAIKDAIERYERLKDDLPETGDPRLVLSEGLKRWQKLEAFGKEFPIAQKIVVWAILAVLAGALGLVPVLWTYRDLTLPLVFPLLWLILGICVMLYDRHVPTHYLLNEATLFLCVIFATVVAIHVCGVLIQFHQLEQVQDHANLVKLTEHIAAEAGVAIPPELALGPPKPIKAQDVGLLLLDELISIAAFMFLAIGMVTISWRRTRYVLGFVDLAREAGIVNSVQLNGVSQIQNELVVRLKDWMDVTDKSVLRLYRYLFPKEVAEVEAEIAAKEKATADAEAAKTGPVVPPIDLG
ncbi:MAG TPA: hypothetical protein VGN57_12360 [Pirellulaceae bacterium]|jgi:hypothetical protein|nr:hypothetical protein [Pirellulaceae bacterium]